MEMSGLKKSSDGAKNATEPLVSQESPYHPTTMEGRSRFHFYLACIAANLSWFASGNCVTWTSPTLPRLLVPNDVLEITEEQSSWIGSLLAFGAIFGPFVAGVLGNRVGRKWTITLAVVLIAVSWVILLFPRSVGFIYFARVLGGVGAGITYTVGPMYIGEIAEDEVRGAMGSSLTFFLFAGFLLQYLFEIIAKVFIYIFIFIDLVGPYVSYSVLIMVSLVPPILFLLVFPAFMPETPYYLLQKGKDSEAVKSLSWLRKGASTDEVKRELHLMKTLIETTLHDSGSSLDLFKTVGNRKALLLSCGLITGQQFSGVSYVIYYTESIFQTTGTDLSASISSIVVGVILILASGIAAPLVKKFGMKWLLIVSGLGMGISQGLLGLYFYLLHLQKDLSSIQWLPIASLVCFISMNAIGFGPIPWAVMAEVFPSNVKVLGSAITASLCSVIGFITTKFFVDISSFLGQFISFWIFSFFCILMTVFTIFELPDTRGMSFDEIQDILNNRRK